MTEEAEATGRALIELAFDFWAGESHPLSGIAEHGEEAIRMVEAEAAKLDVERLVRVVRAHRDPLTGLTHCGVACGVTIAREYAALAANKTDNKTDK